MQTEIYFAFPNHVLRYDCATCDQRCCKTGSLAILPAERDTLISHQPGLELVTPVHQGGVELFATPVGGCWFLEQGRCALRASQHPMPCSCSIFPFNLFGFVEQTLVVAPNGLCPLQIAEGCGITHDELTQHLSVVGAAGNPPETIDRSAASLVLERLICDAAGASIAQNESSPLPLIAFATLATTAFETAGPEGLNHLDLSRMPEVLDQRNNQLAHMRAHLAIDEPSDQAWEHITPLMAAWTPAMRLFGFADVPLRDVPGLCLALGLHAAHWVHMRPDRPLLPQALLQMVNALGPRMRELVQKVAP